MAFVEKMRRSSPHTLVVLQHREAIKQRRHVGEETQMRRVAIDKVIALVGRLEAKHKDASAVILFKRIISLAIFLCRHRAKRTGKPSGTLARVTLSMYVIPV